MKLKVHKIKTNFSRIFLNKKIYQEEMDSKETIIKMRKDFKD